MKRLLVCFISVFILAISATTQEVLFSGNSNGNKIIGVVTDLKTNEVRIKILTPGRNKRIGTWKHTKRMEWFFSSNTLCANGEPMDSLGISFIKYPSKKIHASIVGNQVRINITDTLATVFLLLRKDQLSLLHAVGGLPDERTPGFVMGPLSLEP